MHNASSLGNRTDITPEGESTRVEKDEELWPPEFFESSRFPSAMNNKLQTRDGAIRHVANVDFPTRWGDFRLLAFERDFEQDGAPCQQTALALVLGEIGRSPTLVRIHSQCLTGEALGSLRCDCAPQLHMALSLISEEGAGVLVYEQQEGRGIGLMAKLRAYQLQDQGLDTVQANECLGFKPDYRDYRLPAEILKSLGIGQVRLLSNNPDKIAALVRAGIQVVERIPCEVAGGIFAQGYLHTKKLKCGHLLQSQVAALPRSVLKEPPPEAPAVKETAGKRVPMRQVTPFTDVETALAELRAGRMLVLVDDEDRENEGDLTLAAEKVTPEAINFMATHGRGLICLALPGERTERLRLGPMSPRNTSQFGTAFTESIDAVGRGVTTGISALDRAQTILAAIDPATRPEDLARPGHIFPLRAREGGVLVRAGQTEASVDLARLAGLVPAAVICEIMNDDGTMARVTDLTRFCQTYDLKMLTVAELIRYRMAHERCIERVGETLVPTDRGTFRMIAYRSEIDNESHLAMILGNIEDGQPALVRMHARCVVGDVFGANACECSANLRRSLDRIAAEGAGAVIYLHQNATGFAAGKSADRDSLVLHPDPKNISQLDRDRQVQRDIGVGAQVLRDLNLRRIRLLTNHPRPLAALEGYGIDIVEHVPIGDHQFAIRDTGQEGCLSHETRCQ